MGLPASQSVTETKTWINGSLSDAVSVSDRGLQYGDGFFTSILMVDGALCNWSAHWRRISLSLSRLQFPALDEALLLQQISSALLAESDELVKGSKVLKVLITRGSAGRGYQIPAEMDANIIFQLSNSPVQFSSIFKSELEPDLEPEALNISLCQTQASIQVQLAGIKHLNRLENVLARTEVVNRGQQEGLMLNAFQHVISGTQSNLFMIQGDQLITPKLGQSGVEGTTRYQLSLMAASLGFVWDEADITLSELQQADELFLANAVRGIMPIAQLEGQPFSTEKTLQIHQAWTEWQQQNTLSLKSIKLNKETL